VRSEITFPQTEVLGRGRRLLLVVVRVIVQTMALSCASVRRRFGLFVGQVAARYGLQRAARLAGVSKRVALYWKQKARDLAFHAGTWGGSRPNSMLFGSTANDMAVQAVVYQAILENPNASFRVLLDSLRAIPGLEGMTARWLSTTIKSWTWDWARVRLVARNKEHARVGRLRCASA
jgi:hypothetical protein